jgi:hypothetical protein
MSETEFTDAGRIAQLENGFVDLLDEVTSAI